MQHERMPQWVYAKMDRLIEKELGGARKTPDNVDAATRTVFGRLLKAHMEPLLAQARDIVLDSCEALQSEIMEGIDGADLHEGKHDDHLLVQLALHGIERGLQLTGERVSACRIG
jgi:hypothetical protein